MLRIFSGKSIYRFSNGMISQWECPTMHEKVAKIGHTLFAKKIITKLCPSFLQNTSCVLFTILLQA